MKFSEGAALPRPEYPRPQFVRPRWMNLNGEWKFAFDDADEGLQQGWKFGIPSSRETRILVPFPYQCELSGINDKSIHEIMWYSRTFEVPRDWSGMNLLLHFGAVDYECTVWLNGQEVGHNRGGHTPFEFNIAPYIDPGAICTLTLRVLDSQSAAQPRGKQSTSGSPHDIDYYCTSGIWQTVWLEPVPAIRVDTLRVRSFFEDDAFDITVFLHAPCQMWRLAVELSDGGEVVAEAQSEKSSATVQFKIPIPNPKVWSPESPHLYDLRIRLYGSNILLDEVTSYAGLRNIELRDGSFRLNGIPTYLRMVLDQGYWPDGLLAAPSDEALLATWSG